MHAQMHHAAQVLVIPEIPEHQFDVRHLDDPAGAHLQVLQEQCPFTVLEILVVRRQPHDNAKIPVVLFFIVIRKIFPGGADRTHQQLLDFRLLRPPDERNHLLPEGLVGLRPDIHQRFQQNQFMFGALLRRHGGRLSFFPVVLCQGFQIGPALLFIRTLQRGADKMSHAVADPFLVLLCVTEPRLRNLLQVVPEKGKIRHRFLPEMNSLRQFFLIILIEIRDDSSHEIRRLKPDVRLPVGQKLEQEFQRHRLLPLRHVSGIFIENVDIGADILPLPLASGRFNQIAEVAVLAEDTHETDVVTDGLVFQLADNVLPLQQNLLPLRRLRRFRRLSRTLSELLRQRRLHPEFPHVIFEVLQFRIDLLIALPFRIVHIIQLIQNDIEGLLQCIEMDFFRPVLLPAALHPEIRIDQQQGLHRQVLQFQIPDRMIHGDMTDGRKMHSGAVQVGVIIVQIRNPLPFVLLAAVLPDIMERSRAGNDRQIHRDAHFRQLVGHVHGHVMHSADVADGVERGDLTTDPHEFQDVFLPEEIQHLQILPVPVSRQHFLPVQKPQILPGIERQCLPFELQRRPQHLHQQSPAGLVLLLIRKLGGFRKQPGQNVIVAVGQPSFLRLVLQTIQVFPGGFRHFLHQKAALLRGAAVGFLGPFLLLCQFSCNLPQGVGGEQPFNPLLVQIRFFQKIRVPQFRLQHFCDFCSDFPVFVHIAPHSGRK